MSVPEFILTLDCVDQPGIVAAVTTQLAASGGNITESNQFGDADTGRFFMRIAFTAPGDATRENIDSALAEVKTRFGMTLSVDSAARIRPIVILVSRFDHALEHLLYQVKVGWLRAHVGAIVSNHLDARAAAELRGIPFQYLPVTPSTKLDQEWQIEKVIAGTNAELVVLARYMQVLSDRFASSLSGRAINIHHSFLPSFKGARPYHQAHERGVKIIGATAHYVTPDLDEGPIIEQETAHVTHAMSPDDLIAAGRDIESRVLSRAVKLHLERRVMLNGRKTVVFG